MTMPLRPARVVGGLRLWLATFFIAWVREGSARRGGLLFAPRGRPSATALMASVIDSAALPHVTLPRLRCRAPRALGRAR